MGGGDTGEYSDENHLLRSTSNRHENEDGSSGKDLEDKGITYTTISPKKEGSGGIKDLLKRLDRSLSGRLSGFKLIDRDIRKDISQHPYNHNRNHEDFGGRHDDADVLGDGAPPEWAMLLIGCLLGLASGLCVAAFTRAVHLIHEWSYAGTPTEGAAWLRIQRLADTWHRILLIPIFGGVLVGMAHGLAEVLEQIRQSSPPQTQGLDLVAGVFPTVKAFQAAVTLGTGCSLGPEGPSVDIGKSCANGLVLMMENNKEREIALVAAGAASGIASGFNAAVAGCFFAIETVLRPRRAENSPPFTTAMIILTSVISSTVSNVILGTQSAFTVPPYDLKSAAELPLYLILGMLCGVVSVAFTRLVSWFTKSFEYVKERFAVPAVVCPALGGFGAGIIALKYPGTLYWGFTNVEEILHTGKSASAPGIWLLTQLAVAKVVATSLCKGSGLVGGLYAPSLMIGAAIGAVFGGSAAEVINSALPENAAVGHPQAYALVGMAATLASVCSVPLTSVLLLFELTKDYRIILPLMGAVGLAIWVPTVANQAKESETSDTRVLTRGYSSRSNSEDINEVWRRIEGGDDLELSIMGVTSDYDATIEDLVLEDLKVSRAMSKNYVKVSLGTTLKEAVECMHNSKQNCVLVVNDEDLLEGILTYGDIKRLSVKSDEAFIVDSTVTDVNMCLVSSVCTRGISYRGQSRGLLTCYPDTNLSIANELMEAKGIEQLPVVKQCRGSLKERKRKIVAILHYDSLRSCLSFYARLRITVWSLQRGDKP
ncbi:hypothetical protein MANES_01G007500v8 [Manihot esculenta]|uniref:Uncharacterized protein n=1 Tax=Manihot esculenta TaxID=3983 RepID=A0ACB7I9C1_MANES|nr:hypothetical protein MANES_01G007500v8 [Manihot esculenta]